MNKFLDASGLQHLWKQLSLKDYPNNEMLVTVINAIDQEKANKTDLNDYLLIKDYVAGETGGEINLDNFLTKNEATELYAPKNILEIVYPVGAIYLSVNSTSSSILFGFGTWERIEDRFLLGASNTYVANTTGGETSHFLTEEELPPHHHHHDPAVLTASEEIGGFTVGQATNKEHVEIASIAESQDSGGGLAHNNMPPYLAVYIWKRII